MDTRIIKYYRLCKIKKNENNSPAIVTTIGKTAIEAIFTPRQVKLYIRESGDAMILNENVIGGKNSTNIEKIIVILV